MPPPLVTGAPPRTTPMFLVIERKPPRPAAIMLAVVIAACALSAVAFGLGHSKARRFRDDSSSASRSPGATSSGTPSADEDKDDDPSQVDTIYIGDAADAPVPARRGGHVSNVHATILVRLPRYGEQVGLIPDSPAGHLLFGWLAAFNQASQPSLEKVLPNAASVSAAAAQMEMRQQTGGFNLLSAKEVQPGVLVFRLRDQTPEATEVLGTLHVRPGSEPATIASLSLRAVAPTSNGGTAEPASKVKNSTGERPHGCRPSAQLMAPAALLSKACLMNFSLGNRKWTARERRVLKRLELYSYGRRRNYRLRLPA